MKAADSRVVRVELANAPVNVALQQTDELVEAAEKATPATPACPHCGRLLRAEHDLGDHLHCDGPDCVGCCFSPGPVLRPNAAICPANK